MAASTVYVCDGCGVQKGTANHWYMLLLERRSMTLMKWECNPVAVPAALHYCGEACLLRKISERLGRASFAFDAPPVETQRVTLEDEPVVSAVLS